VTRARRVLFYLHGTAPRELLLTTRRPIARPFESTENLSAAACAPFESGTELSLLRPQLRRIIIEFCKDIFPGQFRGGGIMSGHIPRPVGSIALVGTLLVSGVGIGVPASIARADHCLSAPNSLAPQGSHWFYQLDWATQRKCWYLRAFRSPAQQAVASATSAGVTPVHSMLAPSGLAPAADGAPMSASPGDTPPPSPHVKTLAVKPKPAEVITATTDKLTQRSAQEGNTAPSLIEAPAPQLSTWPQTNAQAAGSAPAAPVASPAPPALATVKALEPTVVPSDSMSGDAERIGRSGEPTENAGMLITILLPILALGLAFVGILFRVFMRTVAARRAASQSIDDQDQHVSVDERQEFHSLISAVSDSGLFRAEGGDYQIAHQISKRRDKLAQLRQVLDRLLQHEPRAGRDLAMTGAG